MARCYVVVFLFLNSLPLSNATARERTNFSLFELIEMAQGDAQSISLGKASNGSTKNDVSLPPRGPGWRRIPVVTQRGTHYGADPLVRLIRDGASAAALRHPGVILDVANMSRRGGGPIAQSRSHQAGRDVDVAFYFQDSKGRARAPRRLLRCDPRGRAGDLRLDAAATWTFVRTLLASDDPVVQWMFCSKGVKQLLLDEARTRREPSWLLRRAALVLHQPSDSQPHNDHFHIRIFCGREDRLAGCIDYGPNRAWGPDWDDAVDRRALDLVHRVARGTRGQRLTALDALASLPGAEVPARTLADLLPGTDRVIARRVAKTLLELEGVDAAKIVGDAILAAEDAFVALDLLETLSPWRANATFRTCRALIEREATGPRTLSLALESLGFSRDKKDLQRILPFLAHKTAVVREGSASGLRMLTGLRRAPCRKAGTTGAAAKRCWEGWWKKHRKVPYDTWSKDALKGRGYHIDRKGKRGLEELVRATGGKPEVSYHAQRLLCVRTGEDLEKVLAPNAASRKWRHWLRHR